MIIEIPKITDYTEINDLAKQVHELHVNWRPDLFADVENVIEKENLEIMINNKEIYIAKENSKIIGYITVSVKMEEKEQVEKERDAVIKKTEVLEKRFSALNSKAGLVDSHAREYGYYPEEWLPEAGTLESAKSYRKRILN